MSAQVSLGQSEPTPLNVYYGEIPAAANVYFVATDGDDNNPGTQAEPFATIGKARSVVRRGEVIVLRGGIYELSSTVSIQSPSGFVGELITLMAYPGEVPILDFSNQAKISNQHGMRLNANFWHIIGITIRNASHNGIRMDGSYNILEQVTVYSSHDTGIHMAGGASHNLIKNSDSFRNFNYDTSRTPRIGNNADGFGAKFSNLGPGNRYYGCRAWENSDDGFDFWEAPHTIVVENSWAFGNGDASVFGNPANFEGNGNGFKLGGNHVYTPHVVRNSMAFDNFGASGNAKGFDFNNNWGAMTLEHNTAYNNGRNYIFPFDPPSGQAVFLNNLSVKPANAQLQIPPSAVVAGNSWQLGVTVPESAFQSVNTELAKGPRQQDGSLPDIDLLRPVPGSVIVDAGVSFGIPFYGSAPDIGAVPLVQGELVDPWVDLGSSPMITRLRVYDIEAGDLWALRDDLQAGEASYVDGDATVTSISADIRIDEWIRTAMGTGSKNYLFTAAEFEAAQSTTLLIAHSDDIATKPEWLSAFQATDAKIVLDVAGTSRSLTVYRRQIAAGETVTLGRNAHSATGLPMYLAMLGADVVSTEEMPLLAGAAVLHQNYPNPFATMTEVSFTLPQAAHVSLRVYDMTGREVEELANGHHAAGSHSITWAPAGLSSGVYHVRMISDNTVQTQRVVLVR
jgi:hypothetical protein